MGIDNPELLKVIDKLNRKKKKDHPTDDRPAVFIAGERPDLMNPGVIATPNIAINRALHGGLKRGTIHVFWGDSGTGKTTAGLEIIAGAQKAGGVGLYALSEGVFPIEQARMVGVDLDSLIFIEGFAIAEEALDMIIEFLVDKDTLVPRNVIDVAVIDSVAMLVPKAEMDKTMEDGIASQNIGLHARLMSRATRDINPFLGKCAMVMINQDRVDINSYGGGKTQPGGRAMVFNPKVILKFSAPKKDLIWEGTGASRHVVGHTVKLYVDKNNAGLGGHPHETAEYTVRYNVGTDNILLLFNVALISKAIVEGSKSYYQFNMSKELLAPLGLWKSDGKVDEPLRLHGQDAVLAAIKSSDVLIEAIKASLEESKDG